ncbi:hypothetical protein ACFX2J_015633 [Malus domestica]
MAQFSDVVLGPNGIPLGGLDGGSIPCIVSGQISCVFSQNQLVLYFASELRKNIESSKGFIQEEELDKMEGSVTTATVGKVMMNGEDLSRRFSGQQSPNRGQVKMGIVASEPHNPTGSDVGDEISGQIFAGPAHGDQEAEQECDLKDLEDHGGG